MSGGSRRIRLVFGGSVLGVVFALTGSVVGKGTTTAYYVDTVPVSTIHVTVGDSTPPDSDGDWHGGGNDHGHPRPGTNHSHGDVQDADDQPNGSIRLETYQSFTYSNDRLSPIFVLPVVSDKPGEFVVTQSRNAR